MTARVNLAKSAIDMIEASIEEVNEYRDGDTNYFMSLIWHTNEAGDANTRRMGLGVYDANVKLKGFNKIATIRDIDIYCQLPEAETATTLRITGDGKSMRITGDGKSMFVHVRILSNTEEEAVLDINGKPIE